MEPEPVICATTTAFPVHEAHWCAWYEGHDYYVHGATKDEAIARLREVAKEMADD